MDDPIESKGSTAPSDEPPVDPLALQAGSPGTEMASVESGSRLVYRLRLQLRSIGSLIGLRFYVLIEYFIVVNLVTATGAGLGLPLGGAAVLLIYSLSRRDSLKVCGLRTNGEPQRGTSFFSFVLGVLFSGIAIFSLMYLHFRGIGSDAIVAIVISYFLLVLGSVFQFSSLGGTGPIDSLKVAGRLGNDLVFCSLVLLPLAIFVNFFPSPLCLLLFPFIQVLTGTAYLCLTGEIEPIARKTPDQPSQINPLPEPELIQEPRKCRNCGAALRYAVLVCPDCDEVVTESSSSVWSNYSSSSEPRPSEVAEVVEVSEAGMLPAVERRNAGRSWLSPARLVGAILLSSLVLYLLFLLALCF